MTAATLRRLNSALDVALALACGLALAAAACVLLYTWPTWFD